MSSQKVRILHIEDDEPWQRFVKEALSSDTYDLITINSLNEADVLLKDKFFHIIIIDIGLDPRNLSDDSGMEYLKQLAITDVGKATEFVMLSQHAKYLRESLRDYGVADFIDKVNFSAQFDKSIEQIAIHPEKRITQKFRVNHDLVIRYHKGMNSLLEAVTGLKYRGIRLKVDDPLLSHLTYELDDLLRRMFNDESTIVLERVGKEGFSGAGVLRVTPYRVVNGSVLKNRPLILKFGSIDSIQTEKDNFEKFVRPYQVGAFSTHIDQYKFSAHLGALLYSFVGMDTETYDDFDTFYSSQVDATPILHLFNRLFQNNFGRWYNAVHLSEPLDMEAEYRAMLGIDSRLEEISDLIAPYVRDNALIIPLKQDGKPLPDPRTRLMNPTSRYDSMHQCITHGDLNERNILVDPRSGHPWVIDFATTNDNSHMLRDFAQLDMSIRLELLRDNDVTLDARYAMEKLLTASRYFRELRDLPETLPDANSALQKTYQCTLKLRRLAFEKLGQHEAEDLYIYYVPLFYYTFNSIRYRTFTPLQREHAILSCSLLLLALNR